MKQIVGLITILASLTMAVLTAVTVKRAGGFDILTVVSIPVVILLFVGGIAALRSQD